MSAALYLAPSAGALQDDPVAWIQRVRAAGFAGAIVPQMNDRHLLSQWLSALQQQNMPIAHMQLCADVSTPDLSDDIVDAVTQSAQRMPVVMLSLSSTDQYDKPSSSRPDSRAAGVIAKLSQHTRQQQQRLALLPCEGNWLANIQDAVRMLMRVNRPDLLLGLPVSDWAQGDLQQLDARLQLAGPRLWSVHISTDPAHSERWQRVSFLLRRMGYQGVYVLQQTELDITEAMSRWRQLCMQKNAV